MCRLCTPRPEHAEDLYSNTVDDAADFEREAAIAYDAHDDEEYER